MVEHGAKYQYLAAFVANLITVSFGISEGWPSPNLILLESDETPLPSGKITSDDSSWIAALLSIGCLFGNISFGVITNKFGRRWPLILICIPTILSWLLVYFAQNVYYLYASRLLIGFFGGGSYTIVPLFLSEISVDRVRGLIVSTLVLSENSGILIAFILGHLCGFRTTPIVVMALIALSSVLIYFFPETPLYLVKQNKIAEAEKSIEFYQSMRGANRNSKFIQEEIEKLKRTVNELNTERSENSSLKWSDFKTIQTRKAFIIGIVLVALNQFSGVAPMLNYTAHIFQESGSTLSPNDSAIVVGVIQVVGSVASTNLVDRAGRKLIFGVSTIGTALGLIVLGIYMMLKSMGYSVEAYNWIPLLSYSFVILIANLALLTIIILVISEVMPERVKDFGLSFCMSLLWIFSFVVTKFIPSLTADDALGFHGSMFLFAIICLCGGAFIILFVPETKGRSYEEIQYSLR